VTLGDRSSNDCGGWGGSATGTKHFKEASQTLALSNAGDTGDKSLLTTPPISLVQSWRGDGWRTAPRKARSSMSFPAAHVPGAGMSG